MLQLQYQNDTTIIGIFKSGITLVVATANVVCADGDVTFQVGNWLIECGMEQD